MYDLIIVGGGPSGSAAGRVAGKMGLGTLLLEKEIFPRYKPCGGAFSEQAMSYLDFDVPQSIIERDVFGARVHFRGQVIEKHKEYRISTIVTRSVLDNYLLEKVKETGTEVKTGERVTDFKEDEGFVEVFTDTASYRARFLIVAEGAHGRLKYRIRRRDKKDEYGVCLVTEIDEANQVIDRYIRGAIDIHFGVANLGYGWIFPHEKYFSVGIGGMAEDLSDPKKTMTDFLLANGFKGTYKSKAHLIPAGGIKRKLVGSRVVLAGDAAGFVDSFYGEGIAYAIRSGQIAAEIISDIVLQNKKLSRLQDYQSVTESEFGRNLKYSLMLSRLMHRFPGIFFKIFTGNEDVMDKYLEVPSLRRTYKSYLKWLIPRVPKFLLRGGR